MEVIHERCAGLDVHKCDVVACRLARDARGRSSRETRTFKTMTQNLLELSDWLSEAGVTHVAMESTGEFWKPIYYLLEGNFELLLVNARHIKTVPGRKTDVGDAQWIADLLQHGLLRASFVPTAEQRALRELTRHRSTFIRHRATICNRIQKLLEGANIKLASVATDVLGASGREMLNAIAKGEDDANALAEMARGRLRKKDAALKLALDGRIQPYQRVVLKELLAQVVSLDESIERLSFSILDLCAEKEPAEKEPAEKEPAEKEPAEKEPAEKEPAEKEPAEKEPAEKELGDDGNGSSGASPEGRDGKEANNCGSSDGLDIGAVDKMTGQNIKVKVSLPPPSFHQAVSLLMTMTGVGRTAAEIVIAEIGTDMSRFPSDRHLSSWAGLASGNNQSAGKNLGGRTTYGNTTLKTVLIQIVQAALRTKKKGYLHAKFARIAARRGTKKALMAIAHAVLVIFYHMLKNHQTYQDLGADYLDSQNPMATAKKIVKRISGLGEATIQCLAELVQETGLLPTKSEPAPIPA